MLVTYQLGSHKALWQYTQSLLGRTLPLPAPGARTEVVARTVAQAQDLAHIWAQVLAPAQARTSAVVLVLAQAQAQLVSGLLSQLPPAPPSHAPVEVSPARRTFGYFITRLSSKLTQNENQSIKKRFLFLDLSETLHMDKGRKYITHPWLEMHSA